MRKILYLSILCVLFFAKNAQTQFAQSLTTKLNKHSRQGWEEKVHIHVDKHLYTIGETIWFKVYLVEGFSLQPRALSTLVHVELIGPQGELAVARKVKIHQGGGAGEFILTDNIDHRMQPGRYRIRAYTDFQRNFTQSFFERTIEVLSGSNHRPESLSLAEIATKNHGPDIQFFPEGGDMVAGLPSRVAFKATDSTGYGIGVVGDIYDQEDHPVSTFETTKFGIGVFTFTPLKNHTYHARIQGDTNRNKYPLPPVLDRGYTLSINNQSEQDVTIHAQTNLPEGLADVVIIGQLRGGVFFHALGKKNEHAMTIRLPKKGLLYNGIATITLFGPDKIPHCERLIFLDTPDRDLKAAVTTDHQTYARRDPVDLTIHVGEEVKANLSLSVTNFKLVKPDSFATNIKTNLLLTSDLKGHIENPGYYFIDDQPERRIHLDYLLMTQGWRRFSWEKIMEEKTAAIDYFPERGFNFSGQLTNSYDGKPTSGKVSLMLLPDFSQMSEVITDKTGKFIFAGYDLPDTTHLIIQGESSRVKKNGQRSKPNKRVVITMDEHVPPKVDIDHSPILLQAPTQNSTYGQYVMQSEKQRYYTDTAFALNRNLIMLEEITVEATAPDPFKKYGTIYGDPGPNRRLVMDSLGAVALASTNIFQLLQGRMAGVQVTGRGANYSISIRGGGTPLYLFNNIPVDSNTINMIPPQDIHHIDVLKGPETAIFGSRGANGVIAIFTKTGEDLLREAEEVKSTVSLTHPGYYRPREFYSPRYDVSRPEHNKPDHRITLHWQPEILTDSTGRAIMRFYTADDVSTYRVELEGITDDGRLVRAEHFFEVR